MRFRALRPAQFLPFDRAIGRRFLLFSVSFFLLYLTVYGLHYPFRELPFWDDSVGYMVLNTRHMAENHTLFGPAGHDPGHPPLCFLALWGFWTVFGHTALAGHLCEWFWTAWLIAGAGFLGYLFSGRSRLAAFFAMAFAALHPHYYALANSLLIEVPMAAFFLWMLYGFHAKRPAVFVVATALLALSKMNALVLLFAFLVVEMGLYPAARIAWLWRRREERNRLLRDWLRWVALTALALAPLALWLPIHRIHQGFWIQSRMFDPTTRMAFDWESIHLKLVRDGVWAIGWTEGNRLMVECAAAALVAAGALAAWRRWGWGGRELVASAERPGDGADAARPTGFGRDGLTFPAALPAVVSLTLQGAIFYFLHACKVEVLQRYYATLNLQFMLAFLLALGALRGEIVLWANRKRRASGDASSEIEDKTGGGFRLRFVLSALTAGLGLVLSLNFVVRLHPDFPDRVPFLSPGQRDALRNHNGPTYDLNLQIVKPLWAVRKTVRWLEKQSRHAPEKPIVVAAYPFGNALSFPEGGYLRGTEGLRVVGFTRDDELLHRQWDYMIKQEYQLLPRELPSDEARRARGIVRRKYYGGEGCDWNFEIEILMPTLPPPAAAKSEAGG